MFKKLLTLIKTILSTRYLIHRLQNRFISSQLKDRNFNTVVDIGAGRAPYKKFVSCQEYIIVDVENRGGFEKIILADVNKKIRFC